jgi:small subunit ribosomal protein S16
MAFSHGACKVHRRKEHHLAVHIRLTRVGATRRPAYRVIAIDSRRARDGRALEILGYYNPLTNPITIKLEDERIASWVARGARPSAAVQRLMKVAAAGPTLRQRAPAATSETPEKPRRTPRARRADAEAESVPEPTAEAAVEVTAEPAAEPEAEPSSEPTEASVAPEAEADAGSEPIAKAAAEPDVEGSAERGAETADEAGTAGEAAIADERTDA